MASGLEIESPEVPRTYDLASDQIPLTQRPASVRAAVVESKEPLRGMDDRDVPAVDDVATHLSRRDLMRRSDIVEF